MHARKVLHSELCSKGTKEGRIGVAKIITKNGNAEIKKYQLPISHHTLTIITLLVVLLVSNQ
jgi:hypothetical protein